MLIETNVLDGKEVYRPNWVYHLEDLEPPNPWGQSKFEPDSTRTQRLIDSIYGPRQYNVIDDALSHGCLDEVGHEYESDSSDNWKYTSLLVKESWLSGHISTKVGNFDFMPFGHLPPHHPTVFLGKRCFICNRKFRQNDLVDFIPVEPFQTDGIARTYLSHRGCFHLYIAGLRL